MFFIGHFGKKKNMITFDCSEELSGTAEIEFYLLSETSNWPVVVTDLTSGQVEFTPETYSIEGSIDDESIEIDASPKQSAEGMVWPIDISLRFITRSESMEQYLDQYQNKPGIVIAKLNNGFRKMYGTNEEPLFMTWKVDEGKKITDNAGTLINIKGETQQRPAYYTV